MNSHSLTPEGVREEVSDGTPGFYRLGVLVNGDFHTAYFGRSDTCLQRRLCQWAQLGWYPHFVATVTETVEEAYRLECRDWHLHGDDTVNQRHPAAPDGTTHHCEYCDLNDRLAELSNNGEKLYTHG